jgi:hypothetical protein
VTAHEQQRPAALPARYQLVARKGDERAVLR